MLNNLSLKQIRRITLSLNILLTLGILAATLLPGDFHRSYRFIGYDKVGHFLMFYGWTFFFGLHQVIQRNISLWWIFLTGCFFGIATEVLQYIVPTNRTAEFLDFIADIAGALLAIGTIYLLKKYRKLPGEDS